MTRILHVVPLQERAGVQVMFINYLNFIKENHPEILGKHIVLAINHNDAIIEILKKMGVKVYKAERKNKYDLRVLIKIQKIIKAEKISVVYGQNSTGNIWAYLASLCNRKVKLIYHEHGSAWMVTGLRKVIYKMSAKKSNIIICNSRATKTILMRKLNIDSKKLKVIYNGVPDITKSDTQIIKDKSLILFVGRLDVIKSPQSLLYSLPAILERNPKVNLVILGNGILKEKLMNIAKELKIDSNVVFKGNVSNVDEYMSRSALLVLPSIRESLGNVVIEAALQKTATVATNIDGLAEVIVNNETGVLINPVNKINRLIESDIPEYVVNPDNNYLAKPKEIEPNDLGTAIIELIENKDYIQMGKNAEKHVRKKFSMSKYYKNIENVLENVLNKE